MLIPENNHVMYGNTLIIKDGKIEATKVKQLNLGYKAMAKLGLKPRQCCMYSTLWHTVVGGSEWEQGYQ